MAVLEVNNVSKTFGDFKAVQDVTFRVEAGRMYGVLGPNGAGKTTTIRMIMNILIPDRGDITLFGQHMNDDLKNRIGYLPEERGLYPKMKVIDLLAFFGQLQGMSNANAIEAARKWMKKLELAGWEDNKVEELSKGMQQKIQFIATVMHDPELVILDEPFSGLDPVNVQLIKNIMMELRTEGRSIMFSTHVMEAAEKLCDDILLINKGHKVLDGKLVDIKQKYGSDSIQIEYDGDSSFLKEHAFISQFNDYGKYVEVKLHDGKDGNSFLKQLTDKIQIRRYQMMESSLNDIFIEIVGEGKDDH